MEVTDSAITVFSNMWLVAGVYFPAWQYVSDSCAACKRSDHSSPALIVVYLHVEACPLRCKIVLRHWGGCQLVWLDLMGLHAQRRTLCQRKSNDYVNCISKAYATFSRFEQTYSLALWRHEVFSWPAPLPPSASALSLAEVRKTVLKPNKLRCLLGLIFSLFFCPGMIQEVIITLSIVYAKVCEWSVKKPRCCNFPPTPSVLLSNSDHPPDPQSLLLKKNPIYHYHLSKRMYKRMSTINWGGLTTAIRGEGHIITALMSHTSRTRRKDEETAVRGDGG